MLLRWRKSEFSEEKESTMRTGLLVALLMCIGVWTFGSEDRSISVSAAYQIRGGETCVSGCNDVWQWLFSSTSCRVYSRAQAFDGNVVGPTPGTATPVSRDNTYDPYSVVNAACNGIGYPKEGAGCEIQSGSRTDVTETDCMQCG